MQRNNHTAAILIIGDEILSGRTQDKNTNWLAKQLTDIGIRLREVRVIPDDEDMIVAAVNHLRSSYSYLFTTGGIGPTHDDITSASIAKAFSVELLRNQEAVEIMEEHYGKDKLTAARLKMANIPQGAALIANPVSAAPGFRMDNVYVMAGVPAIMQAMFDNIKGELQGGEKILSQALHVWLPEGELAGELAEIQHKYPQVAIGSYPFIRNGRIGVSLVVRGTKQEDIETAIAAIKSMIESLGGNYD